MEYDKEVFKKTGIMLFENAISPNLCSELIEAFESSNRTRQGATSGGVNTAVKNSIDFDIMEKSYREKLDGILNIAHFRFIEKYWHLRQFSVWYTGFQMQKSKANQGFFKQHIDADLGQERVRLIAPIFYLNDIQKGGETAFPLHRFKVKAKQGRLVLFPATYTYPHEGIKPVDEDKYIITCFGNLKL